MPNTWLENSLLNRTRLSGVILLSLAIHFIVVAVYSLTPVREEKIKGPPPIQVRYIEPEKPMANKSGRIVATPEPPKKTEKAMT